jgi:hypothetical protein
MDNQHRKIKGYRELSEADIALMNRIKEAGLMLEGLVNDVRQHISEQFAVAHLGPEEIAHLNKTDPFHWTRAATDDLQVALMKLTRAVAQPTTF